MNVIIVDNPKKGAQKGFEIIEKAVKKEKIKVLGLATGSTPVEMYQLIQESDLDFSDMVSINLDEYIGLAADHPQSYHYFMQENLFDKKPFKKSYLPNGLAEDAQAECQRYDQIIKDHPIDLQILGLGTNGHVGFNEPGASFDSLTEKVELAPATIQANARFFASKDEVPRFAYSMGIKSILSAKKILLFAYGKEKAPAVRAMVEGEISEALPASALRKHPQVTVIIDQEAAHLLQ